MRELAAGGLRTADYASGRTWQIDTAVRNAVRTSVGQLTGEITQEHIESSGAPMVQVSQHWGARESHALWQGGIYTVQQFKTVCGYGEPSNPDNIYSYNCRHHHYPYWPGISEPIEYQPEPGPFEVGGRKYTYYQATQKQRAMERDIRAIKRDALAQDAMGDKSALAAAKIKLDEKMAAYKSFSAQINIREKLERTTVFGYDRGVSARGRGAVIWRRNLTEIGNTGVLFSDVQFGIKIGKHARDFDLNPGNASDRALLMGIIGDIISGADEVVPGGWRGQIEPVMFFIKGDDVVVTTKNKEFVTILKGGINNARVKDARGRKI